MDTTTQTPPVASSALLGFDGDDPYQSDDYQKFLGEAAKHCHCDNDICDSVLAGGLCEGRIANDHDDDNEPDFSLDDLEWSERYPHL